MFYAQQSVLVTGGAGFIGSALVAALVAQGAYVTVLDDLSSGTYENIRHLKDKITFIQGSIMCKDTCSSAMATNAFVFHCAAFVSVPSSYQHPEECYATNLQGTLNVLAACKERNAQRMIFSSSCAVYGPQDTLLTEDTLCLPQSPYGLSKFIGELLCKQYTHLYGVPTISLRYFNVMAPGLKKGLGVVACFERALNSNKDLVIYGDGTQTRDFVSLEAVVEANLKAGMVNHESFEHQVINIASGETRSINQLLEELLKYYPLYTGTISYQASTQGDVKNVQAHIGRYQQLCCL